MLVHVPLLENAYLGRSPENSDPLPHKLTPIFVFISFFLPGVLINVTAQIFFVGHVGEIQQPLQ